jgi:hypothetical protein
MDDFELDNGLMCLTQSSLKTIEKVSLEIYEITLFRFEFIRQHFSRSFTSGLISCKIGIKNKNHIQCRSDEECRRLRLVSGVKILNSPQIFGQMIGTW